MFLKNAIVFPFSEERTPQEISVEDVSRKVFSNCLPTQRESMGFIPPMGKDATALTHQVDNKILMQVQIQSRILPASVITDALNEAVEETETIESRKLSAKEKKEVREEIEFDLLPKAFLKNEKILLWVDLKNGFTVINTPSSSKAESVTSLLREALGSYPCVPFETHEDITRMSRDSGIIPDGFSYTDIAKFAGENGEKGDFQGLSMESDELELWRDGSVQCKELGLEWDEKITFSLNDKSEFKKIKFLDVLNEKLNEEDPQSYAEKLDIEFSLIAGEMGQLIKGLQA